MAKIVTDYGSISLRSFSKVYSWQLGLPPRRHERG